ncbi:MAG: NADH:flavin oxidoreductase [Anaerolineae bacterium]|nr:NADH:flavin oxidoreductase [Anaerolineae bacterium]
MTQLFEEGRIGSMTLRNRIIKSATFESMSGPNGACTEELRAYHRRIAAGGAALLIAAYVGVHPSGVAYANQSRLDRDELIPGFRELTHQVHDHGALVVAQLNHAGRVADETLIGHPPLGPSPIPDKLLRTRPREMTEEEIETVLDAYAAAAVRAREAGFDGVQLHCAHGYLISQFLSPATNQRADRWGGTLENRQRFALEAVRRTRKAVGLEYPLLVKLNYDDFLRNGFTLSEAVDTARKLAQEGVDAIEVSGGFTESVFYIARGGIPIDRILEGMSLPKRMALGTLLRAMQGRVRLVEGYNLEGARAIKAAVPIPVISVGGFRSREVMEQVLRRGEADFISLARPLIREPDLPTKFQRGGSEKATCVSCNLCLTEMGKGNPVRCYYTG